MTLNLDHYSGCSDPDQEFIYFMGSERLPSTCYLLSDESLETLSSACYILSRKRFLPPVAYFPTNTLPSACYIISDEYYVTGRRKRFDPTKYIYSLALAESI